MPAVLAVVGGSDADGLAEEPGGVAAPATAPDAAELALLEPYRAQLRASVFDADTPDPTVQFEEHPQGGRKVPLMMPVVGAR